MRFSPIPDHSFDKLTDVTPEFLKQRGIDLLLLDLDNTIAPYGTYEVEPDILAWAENMKSASVDLMIVSNSRSDRPERFAESLDINYIKLAKKPSRKGVIRAMKLKGRCESETALAGDQVYTDALAANRSGVTSIVVEPISLKNPLLAARYVLEIPFRALCKDKHRRG